VIRDLGIGSDSKLPYIKPIQKNLDIFGKSDLGDTGTESLDVPSDIKSPDLESRNVM
jgi:hypothetical protein